MRIDKEPADRIVAGCQRMATRSGEVEGQAMARRLVEAVDADRPPDWDAFHGDYGAWLMRVAGGCLSRSPGLRSHFDEPQDLVHSFLADKVMPPRQARLMLGGPAQGTCPLRPRLAVSLRNYCVDLLRSGLHKGGHGQDAALQAAEAHEELPLPDFEDVEAVIRRQMEAIRSCVPLNAGVPYRPVLLLRHRLDWAGVFDGVRLRSFGGQTEVELSLALLEQLTSWQTDETAIRLGESRLTLGNAWEELTPQLLAAADRSLPASDVAGVLRIPRDLWDQWVSRGRARLRNELGGAYAETFALWA